MNGIDRERYLFSAADMLDHRRRLGIGPTFEPPQGVILCYQAYPLEYAARSYKGRKKGGFHGDFYLLKKMDDDVGIVGKFGVGAPVTAVLVEELAALGVTQFISIGICGGLSDSGKAGDLVIASRAIRDEGTSRHYLPASTDVTASAELVTRMENVLTALGRPYRVGTSWTTDAPYREKLSDVVRFQNEGVIAVDMEAAALFAVARHLGLDACAAFVVGDAIEETSWRLDHDPELTRRGLRVLVDAAVRAITT